MAKSKARSKSSIGKESSASRIWISILERLKKRFEDIGAIVSASLALLTILGLLGLTKGALIDAWTTFIRRWLGWGVWVIPIMLGSLSYVLVRRRQKKNVNIAWHKVIAAELFIIGLLVILAILGGMSDRMSISRAEEGIGGGLIGWGLATVIGDIIGEEGSLIFFLIITLFAGLYAFQGVIRKVASFSSDSISLPGRQEYISRERIPQMEGEPDIDVGKKPPRKRSRKLPHMRFLIKGDILR